MRAWNDWRSSNLSSNHGSHGDRPVNFPSWDGITREAPTSKRSVGGGSMSQWLNRTPFLWLCDSCRENRDTGTLPSLWVCHFLCPRQTDKKSTGFGDFPSTGVLVRKGKALSVLELFPSVFRLFGIDSTQSTLHQSILWVLVWTLRRLHHSRG